MMKRKFSTLLLMFFSMGMIALGTLSCATPAVKKPDIKKPSPSSTQGSSQSNQTVTDKSKVLESTPRPLDKTVVVVTDSVTKDSTVVTPSPTPGN